MTISDRSYFLLQHPPVRSQFRRVRRSPVSGVIVVHTAENATDLALPDSGAESVARFIQSRRTPGSYHSLVDSDSTVPLIPPWMEAWQDGTGSNSHAIAISFACRADQWSQLPSEWVEGALEQAGAEVAKLRDWVSTQFGITIPLERITRQMSEYRRPGFISHGERDPGRRSDPGENFPWGRFFAAVEDHSQKDQDSMTPEQEKKLNDVLAAINEIRATMPYVFDLRHDVVGPQLHKALQRKPAKELVTAHTESIQLGEVSINDWRHAVIEVTKAYVDILDRPPDAKGLNYWMTQMIINGMPAEKVRKFIATSPEAG